MRSPFRFLFLSLIIIVAYHQPVISQQARNYQKISVQLNDDQKIKGYLSELRDNQFLVLETEDDSNNIHIDSVKKIIVIKSVNSSHIFKGIGKGILIGAAGGMVVGFMMGEPSSGDTTGDSRESYMFAFGSFFGLLGGILGGISVLQSSVDEEINFYDKSNAEKIQIIEGILYPNTRNIRSNS